MKEELTTDMQYEFMEIDGVSRKDFHIFAASGAISRGVPKKDALAQYGLTEREYDDNIERVLSDTSW